MLYEYKNNNDFVQVSYIKCEGIVSLFFIFLKELKILTEDVLVLINYQARFRI